MRREHREPVAGLVAVGDHLVEGLAVLAGELAQEVPAGPHLVEPLGIVRDRLGGMAELAGDVGGLGLERRAAFARRSANGARPTRAARADPERVDGSALSGERAARQCRRVAVRDRIGEPILLDLERSRLRRRRRGRRAVELVDLVPEEVDLAGPGALVTAECRELGLDLGDASAGLAAGEPRSTPPKRSSAPRCSATPSKRLVAVLAMKVDEASTFVGELRDGGQAAVAIGPRSAVAWDHAAQHDLVLTDHEPALDRALRRAVADDAAVGAPADEQLDGVDEQRLACTGLAREGGHARAEHEHELVDDPEVADARARSARLSGHSGRTSP